MEIDDSEGEPPIKKHHFFVRKPAFLPLDYFSQEWAQQIVERDVVETPLGGLTNLGNSCFINTVLQCLAYSPGLPYFAQHIPNIIYQKSMQKPFYLHHFGEVCRALRVLHVTIPQVFFTNLPSISPGLVPGIQQDAHEFLFALLNLFDDECSRAFPPDPEVIPETPIHTLFGGKIRESRVCQKCNHETCSDTRFLDININLDQYTIEGCFETLFSPGRVDMQYRCEQCSTRGSCENRLQFVETPHILIITMMRFSSHGVKLDKTVRFGFEINLQSYAAPGIPATYDLFAIICHSGHDVGHGHFTCMVRTANGAWYSADDTEIERIEPKDVLSSKPYLLFYRRKTTTPQFPPVIIDFGGVPDDSQNSDYD